MLSSSSLLLRLRRVVAGSLVIGCIISAAHAASVSFNAPLHMKPTDDSPVVGEIPAGTSITSLRRDELAELGLEDPPVGWVAIRSSGPFTGFVRNRDVVNDGAVRPGSAIHVQPLPDAPLLLVTEEGDNVTASEPMGDWSRATLRTELIVFAYVLPPESRSQAAEVTEVPSSPENVTISANDAQPKGKSKPAKASRKREPKPEPVVVETAGAPRTFEGYLMRTRRFLGRGPKYDYQLVDENNKRVALLDLSGLQATSPLDTFENRRVSIYGPGLSRPDVQDVIIRVQTLRLMK